MAPATLTRARRRWTVPSIAFALILSACGTNASAIHKTAATDTGTGPGTSGVATTQTPPPPPPPPTSPLSGLPVDPAMMARPVLVVKIDNVAEAHPQYGINQADVVYEELVENSSTRLMALFQSTDAGPIGPVRSARPTDVLLFTPLSRPLFAWSGANTWVRDMIGNANIVDVGNTPAVDQYYRDGSRVAPHNLFIQGYLSMLASHQEDAGAPPPLFAYRTATDPLGANARPLGSVNIVYGSYGGNAPVDYVWDGVGGWMRSQNGVPHVDSDGVQVAPPNVIIQFVDYVPNGGIPDGQLLGQGTAWVLTAGQIVEGTWVKSAPETPTQFLDATGAPIRLTPGRTWVSLAPPGSATITG
ncbi:MAG: hypothetical protein QOI95_1159 [Acidimicrobiaceae bacterium]|jgi:hypothetical protein